MLASTLVQLHCNRRPAVPTLRRSGTRRRGDKLGAHWETDTAPYTTYVAAGTGKCALDSQYAERWQERKRSLRRGDCDRRSTWAVGCDIDTATGNHNPLVLHGPGAAKKTGKCRQILENRRFAVEMTLRERVSFPFRGQFLHRSRSLETRTERDLPQSHSDGLYGDPI